MQLEQMSEELGAKLCCEAGLFESMIDEKRCVYQDWGQDVNTEHDAARVPRRACGAAY